MNKKRNQQSIILGGLLVLVGGICLILLSLFMPEIPTPTLVDNQSNQQTPSGETDTIGTITLDPGHGGYDDGSIGVNDELEKDITLAIAQKVKKILEEEHVEVIMTRTSDEVSWPSDNAQDLGARLTIAHNSDSEFLVSIHCNFSEEDPMHTSGSEIYANASQSDSVELAHILNNQLKTLSSRIKSRGVKTDMDLYLLSYNQIPSVIVEVGFISNPNDLEVMKSETGQQQIAQVLAEGIMNQLKK